MTISWVFCTCTAMLSLGQPILTEAFVTRPPSRFVTHSTTTLSVLQDFNVEAFLFRAREEFEKLVQLQQQDQASTSSTTTTDNSNHKQPHEESYHKGGNARYQNPAMHPSKLQQEDCETTIIDFATGDELCWGEAPFSPKEYDATSVAVAATSTAMDRSNQDLLHLRSSSNNDYYHKGGNAHYRAESPPSRLTKDDDCDDEHRYIDFATGDELCWAD